MQLSNSILSDQRWICVIDPALAMSQYGVPLITQLSRVMELWVVRELWHILDNSDLYLQRPELITPKGSPLVKTPEQERKALEETFWALKAWQQFRTGTDLAGLKLFWLGDKPQESFLPQDVDLEIFGRWELLANLLDAQTNQPQSKDYILPLAFRDTMALTISLGSAFILTYQPPSEDSEQNCPPEICRALETWGIPCQYLTAQDSMVAIERDFLHHLLIRTDTAKVLWAGVRLAVLHLLVPVVPNLHKQTEHLQTSSFTLLQNPSEDLLKSFSSPWAGAKGVWYLI
jgi:hypothetical protein